MSEHSRITIESLLAETDWLRALARQLVRDHDRAEDLFQETVLASIRDRGTVRGPLRPWLSRVASNLASSLQRREIRRDRRERAVARRAVQPDVVEVAQRFAMQRSVVEAVRALAEPYQTTLLLRYWDDLPPREIARQLAVPVETVKTRLKRGVQQLRGSLDREFGDRTAWAATLVPALESVGGSLSTSAVGGGGLLGLLAHLQANVAAAAAVLVLMAGLFAYAGWAISSRGVGDPALSQVVAGGAATGSASTSVAAAPERDATPPDPARRPIVAGAPAPEAEAEGEGQVVRLVDHLTGKPMPAVIAYWFSPVDQPAEQRALMMEAEQRVLAGELDFMTMMRRFGRPATADAKGEVHLRIPATGPTIVVASTERLEGRRILYPEVGGNATATEPREPREPRVLELRPHVRIPVEVIDATGAPQEGIPVAWFDPRGSAMYTQKTDATGRARLWVHFADQIPDQEGSVGLALAVQQNRVDAHLDHLPASPIKLTLPRVGRLEVMVVDQRGRPFEGKGRVHLHPYPGRPAAALAATTGASAPAPAPTTATAPATAESPATAVARERAMARRQRQGEPNPELGSELASSPLTGGTATFSRVGLGMQFTVAVKLENSSAPVTAQCSGPLQPDQPATKRIFLGAGDRVVAFQVLRTDGRPMGRVALHVDLITRDEPTSSRTRLVADREGWVRVKLEHAHVPGDERSLRVFKQTADGNRRDVMAAAQIGLARAFPRGETRLPGVRLAPAPLIAAGVVVDSRGDAVAGARVQATAATTSSASLPGSELLHWVDRLADGAFELRGFTTADTVRIAAALPGRFLVEPVDVPPGSQRVRVVLARAGSISGSIAARWPLEHLAVRLSAAAGDASARVQQSIPRRFTFEDVAPGRYLFELVLAGMAAPVLSLPVEVPAGREDRPAALQDIDLAGRLEVIQVRVLDPDHLPMAKQRVLRYRPDGGASSIYTDTEGIARVLSPLGGSPIGVKAEGYRPAFLAQVTGERTVVVARPLELELRIAGELPAGVKVRLWLKWVGEPDRLSRDCTVSAELDRGVVKLRMPRPGPYVAQCEFSHRQGAPAALAEVGSGGKTVFAESRLVVHDSAALQPVELKVDAGAMRQALADYDAWLGRFKR